MVITGGGEVSGNLAGCQPVRCRCTGPELQYFRVRSTEAGNATFNAREGVHGDLVLALALAVFGLSRPQSVDAVRVAWAR